LIGALRAVGTNRGGIGFRRGLIFVLQILFYHWESSCAGNTKSAITRVCSQLAGLSMSGSSSSGGYPLRIASELQICPAAHQLLGRFNLSIYRCEMKARKAL
jgi:hypothetical protein